jgi:hypothetical protein
MNVPNLHWPAVAVSAVLIFVLGGLWYSPVLFAKKWIAYQGKSEAELREASKSAGPVLFVYAFLCGLAISVGLAIVLRHFEPLTAGRGALVGLLCWLGFAAPTSFANAVFSLRPKGLWLIDSGYNLVSFLLAGVLLSVWR